MKRFSVTVEFDYPDDVSRAFITGIFKSEVKGMLFGDAKNISVKTKIKKDK